MRVVSVTLRDFRSYARAEAHLGSGLTVVHGPNGAGKSNLLEAIFFGCTGYALRTRNDRELLRFGTEASRVTLAVLDGPDRHELSVGYGVPAGAEKPLKRMRVDGAIVERLVDVETRPLLGVFLPDRLELVKGPPAPRRAHLDRFDRGALAAARGYSPLLCACARPAQCAACRHPQWPRVTLGARELGPRAGTSRNCTP